MGVFSITRIEKSDKVTNTPGSMLKAGFLLMMLSIMFSYLKLAYGITLLENTKAPMATKIIRIMSERMMRESGMPEALNAVNSLFSDRLPKVMIEASRMDTGSDMGTITAERYIIISAMGRKPIPLPMMSSA